MSENTKYARSVMRGAGGAIVFALPMLMTMEMWRLGFSIDPRRLLLLVLLLLPTLVVLSYHAGFESTESWEDDVVDAFVAYGIGFVAAASMLWLLGVLTSDTTWFTALGQITIQAVPASIGALLARSLLGHEHPDSDPRPHRTYGGSLFIMAVGALFLAFNMAPTDEIVLITLQLSDGGAMLLVVVSIVLMHGFVYAAEFRGQVRRAEHVSAASEFLRHTMAGYAVALVMSAYLLWTFGRADGLRTVELIRAAVVLGVPASLGAAAARLIL
jgi:putative integral membrane protein (TIGR02587 family)